MKKNLNIKINFSSIGWKIKNNLGIIYLIVIIALLTGEAFVIQRSVHLILSLNTPASQPVTSKGVRINFQAYDAAVNRINSATTFTPSGEHLPNPFTPQDSKTTSS